MNDTVLTLSNVTRHFSQGGETLEVLRGVDLTIKKGELVALLGESGSGKSTLLQIAGLLDSPTGGEIHLAGISATTASDAKRTQLRRNYLGFIYQFHHLLPEFSACENVAMPLMIAGAPYGKAIAKAKNWLEMLGLAHRADHRPAALSGGEQQRVAIARALVGGPALVLADEPTGNLDPATAEKVFTMFVEQARSRGLAAIVATHNHDLAKRMDRVITLTKGKL